MQPARTLIDVTELSCGFGTRVLFSGLTHAFHAGSVTALLGPSGAGKTTLLGALTGDVKPRIGTVTRHADAAPAWSQQNSPVLVRRTVMANAALGAECRGIDEPSAHASARKTLTRLGLGDLLEARAGRLSGGERQRLVLARAIVAGATVLLVDEPTASLDGNARAAVVVALGAAAADGACVVVATHDPVVAEAAHSVIALGGADYVTSP